MSEPSIPRHTDACDCQVCRNLKARVNFDPTWLETCDGFDVQA